MGAWDASHAAPHVDPHRSKKNNEALPSVVTVDTEDTEDTEEERCMCLQCVNSLRREEM